MKTSDFEIDDKPKLDRTLSKLVRLISRGQKINQESETEYFGLVAACIIDNQNRIVFGLNHLMQDGTRSHAERTALERYRDKYGEPESGCVLITTLSPCTHEDMDGRYGESCRELINSTDIHKVYCGYMDPTQESTEPKSFSLQQTRNGRIRQECQAIANLFLD